MYVYKILNINFQKILESNITELQSREILRRRKNFTQQSCYVVWLSVCSAKHSHGLRLLPLILSKSSSGLDKLYVNLPKEENEPIWGINYCETHSHLPERNREMDED